MPEINTILTYNHPHRQVLITEDILKDIADAIREQRLTEDTFKPSLFAELIININNITGGLKTGEEDLFVEEKDVNFYDYDGTRIYSYTKDLFLELNALPANPSHIIYEDSDLTIDDQPAYLAFHQNANTLLTENMFEDPDILEDLIDSGLINITGALSRGQVKNISTLTQYCESLAAITSNVVNTYDTTYTYDYSNYPTIIKIRNSNLIAQGWNWSLNDAQDYVEKYNNLNIGQMYDTANSTSYINDNESWLEIDIELNEGYLSPVIYLNNNKGYVASDEVDWGDGSSTTADIINSISHTYSNPGKYTITIIDQDLTVASCNYKITGTSSGSNLLTGGGTNDDIYRNCITDIRIGACVKLLGSYAFKNCNFLKTITLHKDLQNISSYNIFLNCYSLKNIIIPNNSTICTNGLNGETFLNCHSLEKVIFPKDLGLYDNNNNNMYSNFLNCYSLKNISLSEESNILPGGIFKECHFLKEINIPDNITSVENYIVQNCYSLQRIKCYPITPPSVTSTTFTDLPIYTKIYVPWSRDHSILTAYKVANYWLAISDQIYLMPYNIETTLAYALYDSNDGSLTFFRDAPGKYINNEVNNTITYYTGIETTVYDNVYGSENVPWYDIKSSITKIIFENEIKPISTCCWFYTGDNLTLIINLNKLNTSNVINMKSMFSNCSSLTSLDLSTFDTSNVTNMIGMFNNCSSLISLDLSTFDTSNVINMQSMFYNCSSLISLDLSTFDTSNVTIMENMFSDCSSFISLDLSVFNTSNVARMARMFYNCNNLNTIYVSNLWNITSLIGPDSQVSQKMFDNCVSLIGGSGTIFNSSYTNKTYARIDNPPDEPGYLTYKTAE